MHRSRDGRMLMLPPKSKRKRPSLETAHQYLKDGSFSTIPNEHYLSLDERDNEISDVVENLTNELPKQFPKTQNLEYAILKSHLIFEYILSQYIRCHSRVAISPDQLRGTFSQKLEIAYLMGFGRNDPVLIPLVELLNKARNQVAHSFSLDRRTVDEAVHIASGPEGFSVENDRQRVQALRQICRFYCWAVAGQIEGEYYFMRDPEDDAS